jgi:hypothetical protein
LALVIKISKFQNWNWSQLPWLQTQCLFLIILFICCLSTSFFFPSMVWFQLPKSLYQEEGTTKESEKAIYWDVIEQTNDF